MHFRGRQISVPAANNVPPTYLKSLLHGESTHLIQQKIIRRLEELNFLDDMRFAKAYAHDKLHFSGWGRRKICQGLWVKRLPPDIIDHACDDIDEEEDEYRTIALRVMKAKIRQLKEWPLSRESKLKVVKFAMTRGFEYPLIVNIFRTEIAMMLTEENQ